MLSLHQLKISIKHYNATDEQYPCVNYNSGVTYTKNIGDIPGYLNTVWYKPKGIVNIMSLVLVQKHHIVTYNSQD